MVENAVFLRHRRRLPTDVAGVALASQRSIEDDPAVTEQAPIPDPSGLIGLSDTEAAERLALEGPNELPAEVKRGVWTIAFEVVREPMLLMLVAAGVIYLVLGEPGDALMLLFAVFAVMGITIVQARRTERALDALKDLSSPGALVIRNGQRVRVPGRTVVRGDLVVLKEGDRVPADGLLRHGLHLEADESLLTGESVPVRKVLNSKGNELDAPGGDATATVFSGTLITAGQGIAEVLATGIHSQLGRIGKALHAVKPERTPLQAETGRLVRTFAIGGLAASAVVVVAYALTRGGSADAWQQGLLAGIALAMGILPEEFPVVLTVFLALGAWRISRSRVLTRRMAAIETLGSATVLCVDKTGTLTQNRMRLRRLQTLGAPQASDPGGFSQDLATLEGPLPEPVHTLLEYAILASRRDPFDPMERALHAAGEALLAETEHLHPERVLLREYPLMPELLAVSDAWQVGDDVLVASKGAPEAIADLCHLTAEQTVAFLSEVEQLAAQGLRVLAVARGRAPLRLTEVHHDLVLTLVGLLGFEDPLRAEVPGAMAECQAAGVRVVMITGDAPATAVSIARQAGIPRADQVMTGAELATLSDEALAQKISEIAVFARVVPEQKLRLVQALKARGEVVAMTGDGVNDAPALKAAHIGIAMGARGTDVAREAAALVLLDDDFASIVAAIRLGRRIFDNIKKSVAFLLAVHVPIAGLSLVPAFLGDWPLLLLPVHIVFLELVIDPSCTLVFESEAPEPRLMQRPPRRSDEPLFTKKTMGIAVLQGLGILLAALGIFAVSQDLGALSARSLCFATLVAGIVATLLVNRSWDRSVLTMLRTPNQALRWVLVGTAAVLTLSFTVPAVRGLFDFGPVPLPSLALSLLAGVASVLWFEVWKWRRRA